MNRLNRIILTILAIVLSSIVCSAQTNPNHVKVNGYYRKDGTYVQPHYRTAPNSTNRDNFSTRGNTNPYTGKPGYITPDNHMTSSQILIPTTNFTPTKRLHISDFTNLYIEVAQSQHLQQVSSQTTLPQHFFNNIQVRSIDQHSIDSLDAILQRLLSYYIKTDDWSQAGPNIQKAERIIQENQQFIIAMTKAYDQETEYQTRLNASSWSMEDKRAFRLRSQALSDPISYNRITSSISGGFNGCDFSGYYDTDMAYLAILDELRTLANTQKLTKEKITVYVQARLSDNKKLLRYLCIKATNKAFLKKYDLLRTYPKVTNSDLQAMQDDVLQRLNDLQSKFCLQYFLILL